LRIELRSSFGRVREKGKVKTKSAGRHLPQPAKSVQLSNININITTLVHPLRLDKHHHSLYLFLTVICSRIDIYSALRSVSHSFNPSRRVFVSVQHATYMTENTTTHSRITQNERVCG
jgi:hypothetical protein